MTTIKERVVQLIEYKKLAKGEFFVKIGMSSSNFRGEAAKTPLNSTAIVNIMTIVPDLNIEWLLTGQGEMLKKSSEKLDNNIKDSTFIPNSFSGLTDEQIEKAMEEALTKKLLAMYESGLIFSAAAVKEYQQREVELANENMKLRLEVERLRQQLDKQQASVQFREQETKTTR